MPTYDILKEKHILVVDDEPDVLGVVSDELDLSHVTTAKDFATASKLMEEGRFDLVILDIMGVRGFDLLDIATAKKIPAVMLTAHAMTPESLQEAVNRGAVSFLPKEELHRLSELTAEILELVGQGQTHWSKLVGRLGSRFRELWGEAWEEIKFPPDSKISW
jgi:DNA-binding NtrC family response regulator